MAGMNQEEKEYMARFVLDARDERGVTVLLIEHHMDVITGICDRMMVLSYGEIIDTGMPREVMKNPRVIKAYLGGARMRDSLTSAKRGPWDFSRRHHACRACWRPTPRRWASASPCARRTAASGRRPAGRRWLETMLGCAAGLEILGFAPGDALLVLGDNRPHLYMGMLAAGVLGGYAMPVYPDATPDEIRHFTNEARSALRAGRGPGAGRQDARPARAAARAIEHIIYDDPRGLAAYPSPGLVSWDKLLALGAKRLRANRHCARR